jgi:hypothetical protein
MEEYSKEDGTGIRKPEKEGKCILMEMSIKENSFMERSTEKVCSSGKIKKDMMGSGRKAKNKDPGYGLV